MFTKVLVANRGEIAVRIMRTLREMGIASVAVHSDADRDALHVRVADRAVQIGDAAPLQSYLSVDRIVQAAKAAGAGAVHPGYGFLSENALLAQRCREEGIALVGPPPEAIAAMGNKISSRRIACAAGVPLIPGSEGPVEDEADVRRLGAEFGYPIALKAAAGGGGYGLRVVYGEGEVAEGLALVRRQAGQAFGDSTTYVEKFFDPPPRHVEIQVLGDRSGRLVHLNERECSLQRRYQKVVEEAPSPVVGEALRQRMGHAAVSIARSIGYHSVGTVEFLLDAEGRFYFLEMNTRLQVEHPVTEMTLGLDLVRESLRVAAGESLSLDRDHLAPRGWAIETRVYAERPERNFMPSPGRVTRLRQPEHPHVRLDSGIDEGAAVPMYYDPLLSKIIAWGEDREAARDRLLRFLDEYEIEGIHTNLAFLRALVGCADFQAGRFHTRYIDEHLREVLGAAGVPGTG